MISFGIEVGIKIKANNHLSWASKLCSSFGNSIDIIDCMFLNSSLSERTLYILGILAGTHLSTWAKPVSQSTYMYVDSTRGFVSKNNVNKSFPIIRYLCSYIVPNLCFNKKCLRFLSSSSNISNTYTYKFIFPSRFYGFILHADFYHLIIWSA